MIWWAAINIFNFVIIQFGTKAGHKNIRALQWKIQKCQCNKIIVKNQSLHSIVGIEFDEISWLLCEVEYVNFYTIAQHQISPIIHDNFIKQIFLVSILLCRISLRKWKLINNEKMLIEMQWRMLTGFQNILFFSPCTIESICGDFATLETWSRPTAIRYTLSENASQFAYLKILIHQNVSSCFLRKK